MPLNDLGSVPDPLADSEPQPKRWLQDQVLFELCLEIYETMASSVRVLENGDAQWEGTLSKLFDGRRHLYSPVMKTLYNIGSCHLVSRGTRSTASIVRLVEPPTLERIKSVRGDELFFSKPKVSPKKKQALYEQAVSDMRQEIFDLRNRLTILEEIVNGR